MSSSRLRRRAGPPALFIAVCVLGISGDATMAPSSALLDQVRARMSRNLSRLPNYTCLETIERMWREGRARRPEMLDRMRLEVGLVNGKELFSWPGADGFEDRSIDQMVPAGSIGNGSFGLHAKMVFQSGNTVFRYGGDEELQHHRALRWDFVIGRHAGGMKIGRGDKRATVGTHGSFWVDPGTMNVIRLDVEADNIPPELNLLSVSDSIVYTPTRVGTEVYLLPGEAELRMRDPDQIETINRLRFNACREYTGESRILDGDAAGEIARPAPQPRTITVPPGTTLDLALDTPVNFDTSAIGDPLTFRLRRSLKKRDGEILFEKGAVVHGRLTYLERQGSATEVPGFAVGIRLLDIEAPGKHALLNATLRRNSLEELPGWKRQAVQWEIARAKSLIRAAGSVFFQPGTSEVLERKAALVWRTVPLD